MNIEVTEILIAHEGIPKDLKRALPMYLLELVEVTGPTFVGYYKLRKYKCGEGDGPKVSAPVYNEPYTVSRKADLVETQNKICNRWKQQTGKELPREVFNK